MVKGTRILVLVSSCLLGEKVRYDGGDAGMVHPVIDQWRMEGRIVPACPEVLGGLGIPRPPVEIRGAGGLSVLYGSSEVVTATGMDLTPAFRDGAERVLELARTRGIRIAVLKEGSPSCGSSYIYDGTFQGKRREGQGVTTALLERHGIRVFSERQLDEAAAYVRRLEAECS